MALFRIEIIEMDAQMQLRGGYEDADGNYIETMTDEEFRREFAALEGHVLLRAIITEGGEHIAVETRTAPAKEHDPLVFEICQSVAGLMAKWIAAKAPVAGPASS